MGTSRERRPQSEERPRRTDLINRECLDLVLMRTWPSEDTFADEENTGPSPGIVGTQAHVDAVKTGMLQGGADENRPQSIVMTLVLHLVRGEHTYNSTSSCCVRKAGTSSVLCDGIASVS